MADLSGSVVVECVGPMTLIEVEEVRDRLRDSLSSAGRVDVDCSEVGETSICFIQLLLAARTSAAGRGVSLHLKQPISASMRDALERGGFIGMSGPTRKADEFWIGVP
ncbi:STAS domain-containing protein [Azospirillum sp. A26]|uniref:STAS domain-containing protein n=1 Tax=Azospirillum sp. A26 TaxID=3160607 RepID=UPI003672A38C